MQDPDVISARLHALSDSYRARKRGKQIGALKGTRGVSSADVVTVLVESWRTSRVVLPDDADDLRALYREAHEDGIVAIGLAAAALPDAPGAVLDLAESWLEVVDDLETADALGWLLLGPGLLACGEPLDAHLLELLADPAPIRRRVAVLATLAALPVPVEGPAAAALRERVGKRRVAFVDAPLSSLIAPVLSKAIKDNNAHVRKATARALRTWGSIAPDTVEDLLRDHPGGVPRTLRVEVEKGIRRGRR